MHGQFGATKKWRDARHNILPTRIVSWGMEGGTSGRGFRLNARSVG
jgi:hypothetical protein